LDNEKSLVFFVFVVSEEKGKNVVERSSLECKNASRLPPFSDKQRKKKCKKKETEEWGGFKTKQK
jgi:hypothetical protein